MNLLHQLARMQSQIEEIYRQLRGIPVAWRGGPDPLPIYFVEGGNTLPGYGLVGIAKRADTVLGSEMPAGSGGVSLAPWPVPAGLPFGVGVARRAGSTERVFVLLDSRAPFGATLFQGDRIYAFDSVTLDKVVGAATYRYTCLVVQAYA